MKMNLQVEFHSWANGQFLAQNLKKIINLLKLTFKANYGETMAKKQKSSPPEPTPL